MYLIRNKDGSIKKAFTNEFVNQGSNNVNYIDMAIDGLEVGQWTADCFFELPNGTTAVLAGSQIQFSVDDVTYNGYRVYLKSAVLSYPGILKAVARNYSSSGNILYSYPFEIVVNATTLDSTYDAPITEAQYESFMAMLSTYITHYDTHLIRKYDTLSKANSDISNISESEHVLISNGTSNYAIYTKLKASDTALTLVPNPTNWSEIENYTGLTTSDLSKLGVSTLKGYIDKYDVKGIANTLLTGVLTTTLTLKDLSTIVATVSFNELYYSKSEVYSKEESDALYISLKKLGDYLTIESAKNTYLSKTDAEGKYLSQENAKSTYLNKEDAKTTYLDKDTASTTYETKADAATKHSSQDLAILNAQNKADSAYALASGKSKVHVFDTYNDMKTALKNDDGTGYALGDSLNIRAAKSPDYWISNKLSTSTGEFGYYEILENESDLSEYQTIEDTTLETTHKTIVGAINENKDNIAAKQDKTDNSLNTTAKTIVGGINENKASVDSLGTSKQDETDSRLGTTSKHISGAINELLEDVENLESTKQAKTDTALETTSKSVVGAINELKNKDASLETAISEKQSKTDVSLNTTDKTVVGAINENKKSIETNATNIKSVESKIPTKVSQLSNDSAYITKEVSNLTNYMSTTAINNALSSYAKLTDIPTDNSELTNGANYIKKDVNTLENYYLKSEVDSALSLKLDKSALPTKLSQFTNDSAFITKAVDNLTYYTTTIALNNLLSAYAKTSELKTNLSDFINDSGFITKAVNNLTYYYLKTEVDSALELKADKTSLPTKLSQLNDDVGYVKFTDYMSDTKAGVAFAIPTTDVTNLANVYIKDGILYAKANPTPVLNIVKVETLPTVGESSTIYLVPLTTTETKNKYKEYIYVDGAWEEFGETQIDLSDYAKIEYVDTQIKAVKALFDNYYTSSTLDTKLSAKLDASKFTGQNIADTLGDNVVSRAAADHLGNNIANTYLTQDAFENFFSQKVSKSGDTMTGTLVAPIIQTGTETTNYFQSQKFRGQGDASSYYHAVDFGYNGHNQIDFYEYGGTFNFWKNTTSTATSDAANRVISLQLGKLIERANTLTYPGKSGTFALIEDLTADNIKNYLGTTPVNRATADKNGNDISTYYATASSLSSYMLTSAFTADSIKEKLGNTAVNRASADASGNVITSTYATKTELGNKLDNTSSAIINTLGDNAVNKATKAIQDENGNNIASTYQKSAFILNGSVSTSGVISFTSLTISELLSAINNKQRIVFIPSDTSLASIDLNFTKTSDTTYTLKGSFCANVSSKLTNYSCVISVTSTTASGTYTSLTANDYTYSLPTASTSTLGGVKVDGESITITNGVIKVAQSGQDLITLLDAFPTL